MVVLVVPLAYIAVPVLTGTLAGRSVGRWPRTARLLAGRNPAPRAWDHVFFGEPSGIVRLQMKDGRWIGGLFGGDSYAAGYPEEPQDIFLERNYRIDDEGIFLRTQDGGFDPIGSGVLVRWEDVRSLEFFELEEA